MASIAEILAANPIVSAPMAGVTDRAWREIVHEMGAGLVYTEMLSDMALCYGNEKTFGMLNIEGEAGPLAVQLCGSSPEYMGKAAAIIEQEAAKFGSVVLLDINMGCPAPKIVKNGEGSRLMTQPELAERIVDAVVKAVSLPVSVKMRLGWDNDSKNVLDMARRVVNCGAALVTVHGRTRQQFYAGEADWEPIAEVAAELKKMSVPVVGNGDITSVAVGRKRMAESGCAGLMIGRAMMGNPWLIRDLVRDFVGLPALPKPTNDEVLQMALRHLYRQVELRDEYTAVRLMRTHLPFYIKGIPGAAAMRGRINQLDTAAEVEAALREFLI
ncbi:MAG: tRNA dihydrouridine synthase DusB [Firmicutes bacterium]|nr:tRNA dihydrouridine synthase DusB [Bacillota bacterium]